MSNREFVDNKAIGNRIKMLRGNISQIAFGKILNYSQPLISQIEIGHRSPTLDILFAIINNYDVSLDYILRGK